MIQFNLLPDVKLQYMKAQRQKNLVISLSTIASIAAISVFVLMLLVVDVWQKKSLSDVNGDITRNSSLLQNGTSNLNKILTVQNQLSSLTSLHDQTPVTSRLAGFIGQLTPATVSISTLNADFTLHTLTITGSAAGAQDINTFTDTLKFATYKAGTSSSQNAFSSVVLTSTAITSKNATYTINATFDPTIFSETSGNITLTVPQQITTRSVLDQPSVFKSSDGN